jgi:Immunity protein 70
MGLYLCVFESDNDDVELEGVEVGTYDDFHLFRSTISERLEAGRWGSRFPTLMAHADSEGLWTPVQAAALAKELATIERQLGRSGRSQAAGPGFVDVDGAPLVNRLIELAQVAIAAGRPIDFQ